MQTSIRLMFIGEDGRRREVPVDSRRFTIGSSADSDLVINSPGISRRHAVIESFDDGVYIYDCQTEHGTLLNNAPLGQLTPLQSGDLLTFGGTHDFTVSLGARDHSPASSNTARLSDAGQATNPAPPSPRAASPLVLLPTAAASNARQLQARPNVALIAGVAVGVLILLVGGLLLLASRRSPADAARGVQGGASEETVASGTTEAIPRADDNSNSQRSGETNALAVEELEREAARIVQRMGGDYNKNYFFPSEAAPRDVRRQVEAYRGSAGLRDAFAAMQPAVRAVATQARGQGIQPELAIYAALAESSDGGQNPVAAARALIPQLRDLRATFGSGDAESSLLILAAQTYGVGSKKSHPLLATMRRLVNNSFKERNVWHLHERGGLSEEAYRAVVRAIAVGVIAENPRRYGVEAAPLAY
jgi:hypothetical protein